MRQVLPDLASLAGANPGASSPLSARPLMPSFYCLLVVVEEIPTSLLGTPSLPLGLVQFSLLLVS